MVPPAVIAFEPTKGPLAKRSMRAGPRLSKLVQRASEIPSAAMEELENPSTLTSRDVRGFRRRLTRRPSTAGCVAGTGAKRGSIGAIRLARPSSASTPFNIAAPSPKSHEDVAREGDVGDDVTIGAP